jgi:2-polyprenyl-6-hydroxyphenyl methylase/3-demethylubiquinone-9 3-methyltransferase
MSTKEFEAEVSTGQRYKFGKNWQSFLEVLSDERIEEAKRSLQKALGVETLQGKTFLDVGCGSGLFSLAAMLLGADKVHSLDYDPRSVACAQELKRRYFTDSDRWTVERGSALDEDYLNGLGQWDIVYSWGVLHHTGNMWRAFELMIPLVKQGGILFLSIYNDQGAVSRYWKIVKIIYNKGVIPRALMSAIFYPYFIGGMATADLLRRQNPALRYRKRKRGPTPLVNIRDWLGGYPFEVAKPEEIFEFYQKRGFTLKHLYTCGGKHGCNELSFEKQ